jgi:hypothetical protein
MHCPDGADGSTYVELVAAVSVILSRPLGAKETFILAEFLQAVSCQLVTLAAFKEKDIRRAPPPPFRGPEPPGRR